MTNRRPLFPRSKRQDNELVDRYRDLFIRLPVMQDFRGWRLEPVGYQLDQVVNHLLWAWRRGPVVRWRKEML